MSVIVSVTVFGPMLAHVKLFGATPRLAIPQLEVLPPSTSFGVIEAVADALRNTVAFLHTATEPTLIGTPTLPDAEQLAALVTVRLNVTEPLAPALKVTVRKVPPLKIDPLVIPHKKVSPAPAGPAAVLVPLAHTGEEAGVILGAA